jgi:hypothetical protein
MRDKWERPDYRRRTIDKAVNFGRHFASPEKLISSRQSGFPATNINTGGGGGIRRGQIGTGERKVKEVAARVRGLKGDALPLVGDGRYHRKGLRVLAGLCVELQKIAGDEPFYLGQVVAKLLGIPTSTARDYLRTLGQLGHLVLIARGLKSTGQAITYRWVAQVLPFKR